MELQKVYINPINIGAMLRYDRKTTVIPCNPLDDEDFYTVKESPEQIRELIIKEKRNQTK